MRAVFLDIDGVINSDRSVYVKIGPQENDPKVRALLEILPDHKGLPYSVAYSLSTVDIMCVALVNKLLALDHRMMLVLSSSHRGYLTYFDQFGSPPHLERLRVYLTALGINVPVMFNITPKLHTERGTEVEQFILQNDVLNIEEHVIIDDSPDFHPGQPFVETDPHHGFAYQDYVQCTMHLALPVPSQIII